MRFIVSITVILSVLFSTTNFHMGAHFCGGELKSFALFGKAQACSHASVKDHQDENVPACHRHMASKKKDKDGCCDDKEIVIESLDITSIVNGFYKIAEHVWVALPIDVLQQDEEFKPVMFQRKKYLNYKPPLIFRDIPVLIQTFLI